jgi:uncharacterized membrane protein YcaP (DUF421 family)
MPDFILQDPSLLLRTLVVGVASYVALVVVLRISGKRTLAKMNAFDFVVTVALGSTLATILISPDVSLLQGLLALALLVGLQWVVAQLVIRFSFARAAAKSHPRLLVSRGALLHDAIREERLARAEILQAARREGFADLAEVEAMVLETDGSFSVIGSRPAERSTLEDVQTISEDGS